MSNTTKVFIALDLKDIHLVKNLYLGCGDFNVSSNKKKFLCQGKVDRY
jgi:hypothetical protein